MDVQNVIGSGYHGAQGAGTGQFGAVGGAVQLCGRPHAVEVVHQLAAVKRARGVERLVGGHVGKADGQRAAPGPHTGVEQVRGGHHAAQLVAVGECIDQHMRPGLARLETVHIVHAHIAHAVGRKVTGQRFKDGRILGHVWALKTKRPAMVCAKPGASSGHSPLARQCQNNTHSDGHTRAAAKQAQQAGAAGL